MSRPPGLSDRPSDRPDDRGRSFPHSGGGSATTGSDSSRFARSVPNNKAGSIGLTRLRSLTSARDELILRSIRDHRLLTTKQVAELHFWNHATALSGLRACNRVLGRLEEHRLVRRLARSVGGHGGGSGSTVWALDVAGDRLLRTAGEIRRHNFEPSLAFQAHTLAIADVHVDLRRGERAGLYELLAIQTEPANWRRYVGELGAALTLKPDLAIVAATLDYEDHWFIEADLGTESSTALIRKCLTYETYRASGREQAANGVFPRVLWIVPTDERAARLRQLITARPDLDDALFVVITPHQLVQTVAGRSGS